MKHNKELYDKHIQIDSLDKKCVKDALQICGELIDASYYLKRKEGMEQAIFHLETLKKKTLTSEEHGILYYYFGNTYADLSDLETQPIQPWENENKEKAIYCYRKALANDLNLNTKSQIQINLANLYDGLGRFVKSLELYNKVLEENIPEYPAFMVHGNKGIVLFHYGDINHYSGQKKYFAYFAFQFLKTALDNSKNNFNGREIFEKYFNILDSKAFNKTKLENLKLNDFPIGESDEEKDYRQWCLKNRLFLNPMNDLGEYNIAAHDVLHLPNMVFDIKQNHLELPSFFNQLKQEYASARYLLYEGITKIGTTHFSDRDVLLINSMDYPRYSLNIEKIKISFRILYSIFDKISLFLNEYLNLSLKPYKVDFRKIWYEKGNFKQPVNNHIIQNNRAFQGLFLISKDLLFHHPDRAEDEKSLKELSLSLEPSAKEINMLRNNLEHGCVKVLEYTCDSSDDSILKDNLSYAIKESDLIDYSMKLCRLCREALIYLSLGVHIDEKSKKQNSGDKKILSLPSHIYEDEWKY